MCVICHSPAGTIPTESQLINSNLSNPDGFGWAVRTDDGIITGRTMDSDKGVDRFLDLRAKWMQYDATYHARITTHGATKIENNHPFRVGDKRSVLFHNGMLPINLPKGETRSDTRIFAEDRLTHMGLEVLDNKKRRKGLESWMRGSKMIIMTERYDLKNQTYILNESDGQWDNGMWWSNSSYKSAPVWAMKWGQQDDIDYKHWWEGQGSDNPYRDGVQCMNPACGLTWDVDSTSNIKAVCQSCWRCLDCGWDQQECFCYDSKWRKQPEARWVR